MAPVEVDMSEQQTVGLGGPVLRLVTFFTFTIINHMTDSNRMPFKGVSVSELINS